LNFLLKRPRFQLFAANLDAMNGLRKFVDERLWDKITLTRDSINPTEIQGVLDAKLDRDALLAGNDIPTDRFIVLCVGQFIDRKGRWVFLEAAKQALEADSGLFFVWVGPELPSGQDLERIAEYGLDGSFKFVLSSSLGTRRQDILEFFRVADIFVLASFLEGLPISIIEAMALGIPTVSTNINGIPEAIIDSETGLLVEPGDATALSQAMIRLRSDDELRNHIAKACRSFAVEEFDERISAAITFDRYSRSE
jgi:glycosyltransferase involved in cell wall biosynthesis